jgi:DnaK suppressor protein
VSARTNLVRSHLEAEKKHINEELNLLYASQATEERREGSPFGKREEEATEALELEKRLALERRLKTLLAEIERALAKIDSGTYGQCDMCNQPIDPARLEALPQANLCMSCRQKTKNAKTQLSSS